ncbi:MAG: hypothetical protein J6386_00180 [Candidatus Synoicihabitans palmerolidicus]|nr:hypothetical protein [Candidatus Synoicihabitans palmerolidicus]
MADQFEAIIVRQRLKPAIEPIMGGGDSAQGGAIAGGGGGVYGYLLTDVLAGKLSEGTGMGLSHMIETQLTPAAMKEAYAQAVKAEAEKPQSPISHHE